MRVFFKWVRSPLESFIIEKVRCHILTEENLKDLVLLTNIEIEKEKNEDEEAIKIVDKQMAEIDRKLNRLYDILETGELDVSDIAPRLRQHKEQKEEIQKLHNELLENVQSRKPFQLNAEDIRRYVRNLQELLDNSELAKKKEFFRSFIQSIIIDYPEVVVNYRFPAGEVVNYAMGQKKRQDLI